MILLRYKVAMCPHCGHVSMSGAKKTFKCNYCNKHTRYFYNKAPGPQVKIFWHTNNCTEASRACGKVKELLAKGKEPQCLEVAI